MSQRNRSRARRKLELFVASKINSRPLATAPAAITVAGGRRMDRRWAGKSCYLKCWGNNSRRPRSVIGLPSAAVAKPGYLRRIFARI
jgi:hypothetical protein